MNKLKSNRILELDALRGIAALMVVLFHFMMERKELYMGFHIGKMGVELFFLISGFVIFMGLESDSNCKNFIINRFSRLYPTYWAALISVFVIDFFFAFRNNNFTDVSIYTFITNFTMFHFYFKTHEIIDTAWTLIVEMLFYILIIILVIFKLLEKIKLIGIILIFYSVISTHFFYNYTFVKKIIYWVPLLQYMPLFLAGILFFKIKYEEAKKIENYVIIFICLISQISLYNYSGYSNYFTNILEYSIALSVFFLVFTLLINNKLNIIVNKYSLFLGKISFSLYLIHKNIFQDLLVRILMKYIQVNFWIASFIIAIPLSILFAYLFTIFIEKPANQYLKIKLKTKYALLTNK